MDPGLRRDDAGEGGTAAIISLLAVQAALASPVLKPKLLSPGRP